MADSPGLAPSQRGRAALCSHMWIKQARTPFGLIQVSPCRAILLPPVARVPEHNKTTRRKQPVRQLNTWTTEQYRHALSLKGATNTARSFSIPFMPNQCVYSTNFLTGAMNISNRGYPDAAAYAGEVPFVSKDSPGGLKGTSVACPIFAGVVSLLNDLRCHSP